MSHPLAEDTRSPAFHEAVPRSEVENPDPALPRTALTDPGWAVIVVAGGSLIAAASAAHGIASRAATLAPLIEVLQFLWAVALVAQAFGSLRGVSFRPPWKTLVVASFAAVLAHQAVVLWLTSPAVGPRGARFNDPAIRTRTINLGLADQFQIDASSFQIDASNRWRFTEAVEQTVDATWESAHFWLLNFFTGLLSLSIFALVWFVFAACFDVAQLVFRRRTAAAGENIWQRLFKSPDSLVGTSVRAIRTAVGRGRAYLPPEEASTKVRGE